ncbi:F-box/kelch-repeat protein At3g23880-like [Vicia villosa]|uniref:F-box/kelch-repeat protein At3g23880-like n=1 Tax=Vicia villosa TaxID=3911 RepID=UPI00273C42FD|nr:F-box/kelch-repeat protein At3g23880-like [Vicia villosa]
MVVAQNKDDSTQSLTKIYTFGEDSWKTIPNTPLTPIRSLTLLGKFVSGTLNWIDEKRGVSQIISFDLEKETYKEILVPQDDGDKVYGDTLYVLNNCLGVCYETNQTQWVAWLMKEYGVFDSWTKFITIPIDKFNMPPSFVFPMFISENGVVLLMNIYTSQFLLYDINSGEFLDSLESRNTLRFNLHICYESLVSVAW